MSTIKVDTYQTRGGASEIAIDKLKGVTAAGSMLVVGEGGTNTTSLQQGLLKAWYQFDGTGTVNFRDSFNMSGTTDGGTGTYANAYTNNMSNTNYAILTGEPAQTDIGTQSNSTDHHDLLTRQGFDSTTIDVDPFYIGVAGDLA